jgi:hypothetical protein
LESPRVKRLDTRIGDLFAAIEPFLPQQANDGPYGPPEPVWAIPQPWSEGNYRMRRGSILKATEADDGRTWLTIFRIDIPILVGASVKQLGKAMPTLPIGGKKAIAA